MILYFKILASFPIIYLVAVKRILTLPSYQAIFQFKQERILAVIKSVLVPNSLNMPQIFWRIILKRILMIKCNLYVKNTCIFKRNVL